MKKLLLLFTIILILLMPVWAFGYTETFYICHGGDASQPEVDSCATAFDEADFNNAANWDIDDQDDGKIGPNDIIYFKDDGGVFSALTPKTSGLSGKSITLMNYSGDASTITGVSYGLNLSKLSFIVVDGLILLNSPNYQVNISNNDATNSSNITLMNLTVTGGIYGILANVSSTGDFDSFIIDACTITGQSNTSIYIFGNASQDITNVTLTNNIISGAALLYGLKTDYISGLIDSGNTIGEGAGSQNAYFLNRIKGTWSISGLTITQDIDGAVPGAAIYINLPTGTGLITEFSIDGTDSGNAGMYISNGSGLTLLTISDGVIDGFANEISGQGLNINNSINIMLSRVTSRNNALDGFTITHNDSDSIIYDSCIAHDNLKDGFSTYDNISNITYKECLSYNNGTPAAGDTTGDGFTAHATPTNLTYIACIAHSNENSGFGFATTLGTGKIYNCDAYSNGNAVFGGTRGGMFESGSGTWIIRNSIFSSNYPYEYSGTSDFFTNLDADYNQFYHVGNGVTESSFKYNSTTVDIDSWLDYSANESNSQYGNPLFANAAGGNFRLKFNSPAARIMPAAQTPYTGIVYDMDGKQITDATGALLPRWGGYFSGGAYQIDIGSGTPRRKGLMRTGTRMRCDSCHAN